MKKQPPKRPADLRRAVLDASLALVEEGGVSALSLREVARRANVTHGAPYHHFADRGAVLAVLAEEGFVLLAEAMQVAVDRLPKGSIARFTVCGRAYFDFATEHRAHWRIMFRPELADPALHPTIDAASTAAMRVLIATVAECQASGAIPSGDAPALVLTSWSTMHGLSALWIDGPLARSHAAKSKEVVADIVARTLTDLVGRRPSGPASPGRA